MSNQRRQLLMALAGTAVAGSARAASDYPNRPVKLMVGYVPGPTGPDYAARVMAAKLTELMGQSFFVENKPGAGGTLATALVTKSPADGYTLLLGETGQLEIAPYLYKSLPYNTLTDLTPIAMLTDGAGIVIVSNAQTTQIRTIADLIREAKANPGKLSYGSAGIGSIHHLIMETFKDGAGLDIAHVPYKGGGQAVPGFLGGEVQILVAALQTVWPHVRSGKANLLAVTAGKRLPVIPDTPSLAEIIPGFGLESQLGLLGPPGMPADVIERLSTVTRAALDSADIKDKLSAEGTRTLRWTTPQEYADIIRQNLKKYEKAVLVANVRPE